mmetsp:Transcript_6740/g.25225  ORF Transcript_6740/g.25225 Transcript_6740/m.25225 type:complete len:138 (-) Transcript_6740:65-478(-)
MLLFRNYPIPDEKRFMRFRLCLSLGEQGDHVHMVDITETDTPHPFKYTLTKNAPTNFPHRILHTDVALDTDPSYLTINVISTMSWKRTYGTVPVRRGRRTEWQPIPILLFPDRIGDVKILSDSDFDYILEQVRAFFQ